MRDGMLVKGGSYMRKSYMRKGIRVKGGFNRYISTKDLMALEKQMKGKMRVRG